MCSIFYTDKSDLSKMGIIRVSAGQEKVRKKKNSLRLTKKVRKVLFGSKVRKKSGNFEKKSQDISKICDKFYLAQKSGKVRKF